MKVPLLDLKAQYSELKSEIIPAIEELCDSQYFILGENVEKFEREIAEYCGTPYA
ncbi:MAG: DegT/DnrJ/EryC1/StrS family aminotransferase, partial [Victivallales bacterium]|nr:DegT/DnrJ/EryC1/StrS family aminotransferase [Victivallales bacterium]